MFRETKFKQLQKLTSHVLALCSANDSSHQVNTAYTEDKMPNLIDFHFNNLMNTRPEPWIVIGYYNLSKKQTRTIFFANKVIFFSVLLIFLKITFFVLPTGTSNWSNLRGSNGSKDTNLL